MKWIYTKKKKNKKRLLSHVTGAVLASPLNKEIADALLTLLEQSSVYSPIFLGTHDLYSKGHFTSIEG